MLKKLKTVPVDLSKLSNVVNNDVVKKTVYDKLVAKINNIDISRFILKTKYDTDKSELEIKIIALRLSARVLRKLSGSKEHLDWLKIDLNAAKIITVQDYKCT